MDINNLTIGQLKEIKSLCGLSGSNESLTKQFRVGDKVFIRTVTLYYTGRVKDVYSDAVVLDDAAWIADTGRFYDFLKKGTPNEVEPFPDPVTVPLGSIIDHTEWKHELLRTQK